MSLQIWLPLNGDLHNQGLSGLAATNTGAVVNNSGKIGKCYQFGTASSYITLPKETMTSLTTEASFCFWLNIISWNTSWATFLHAGLGSTPWTDFTFGFLRNGSNSTCCFSISDNSTSSQSSYKTPALELNTWYHIACVYKTGHCLIYINGSLYNDYTTTIVPNFANITNVTIGKNNNKSSYQTNCLMNDFRLYNHALSSKEVEEIAKGLVLHYKLDQNLNILNNCFSYPTFDTSAAAGGWNHWAPSGSSGSYGQNTNTNYIFRSGQTYSHWFTCSSGNSYLLYQEKATGSTGIRSLQCLLKEENSLPITTSIVYPSWNARQGGIANNIWTSITNMGNGWYLCKSEGILQSANTSGNNALVGLSIKPGYKVYVSELYLENDREICSDIFNQNNLTTIYDSSGYSNNGAIVGSLVIASPSPRYDICTNFASSSINTPLNIEFADGNFTVAFWAQCDNWSATSSSDAFMTVAYHGSNSGFSIYHSKNAVRMRNRIGRKKISDNTTDFDNTRYSHANAALTNNTWYHFIFSCVYDGTNLTLTTYQNGTQYSTTTYSGYVFNPYSGTLTLSSPMYQEGKISDFRIYATALTDGTNNTPNQVKELYTTSMSIDSSGNIYARELVEL